MEKEILTEYEGDHVTNGSDNPIIQKITRLAAEKRKINEYTLPGLARELNQVKQGRLNQLDIDDLEIEVAKNKIRMAEIDREMKELSQQYHDLYIDDYLIVRFTR